MLSLKLVLYAMLLGISLANAQPLVRVTGFVTDEENKPLHQVTISILGQQQSTLTNENGEYIIYSNTTIFIVKYNLLGYNPVLVPVTLDKAGRITQDVKLLINANELEQVRITTRQNQLSNSTVINVGDASMIPAVSGNFEAMLKNLPGVSTNNELSAQYSVRGGTFDENLVYVNDVEISRPVLIRNAQQEGLSFVNGDLVSAAKFSAGGFESRYGDKLSSVLDVKYLAPDSTQTTLTAGFLGASFSARFLYKNSYLLTGLRYKNNTSVLNTQENKGSYTPNFTDAQVVYHHKISERLHLNFMGNFNAGLFKLIPESRETQFGTLNTLLRLQLDYTGQEIDDYQTIGGAVSTTFMPEPNFYIKWINSYFNTLERERFDINGDYVFDEINNGFGDVNFGTVRANRGFGSYINYARNSLNSETFASEIKTDQYFNSHTFSWGMRFEKKQYTDRLNEYNLIDSAGYILPDKTFPDNSISIQNQLSVQYYTAYVQDSYSLTPYTDLQLGVRANYNTLSAQLLVSPRMLLAYRPPSNNKIYRFTAGIYQQAPDYRSIRDFSGKLYRDQKAQRSYNTSAGYDHAFDALGTRLKFTSEVYAKYSDRLIPYIVDNMRIRYLSDEMARGYTYGTDLSIGGEFVRDLVSYFRISFMKANQNILNDSYMEENSKGEQIRKEPGFLKRPTDQRLNFSIYFQDRLLNSPTYKVHLNLLYGSRLPVGAPQSSRYTDNFNIPAYKRVDIGFSKDFLDDAAIHKPMFLERYFSSFSLSFEVFNLLNINNTVSYLWLKDVDNIQYAVPNYLTGRQLNLKLMIKFKNSK